MVIQDKINQQRHFTHQQQTVFVFQEQPEPNSKSFRVLKFVENVPEHFSFSSASKFKTALALEPTICEVVGV